MEEFRLPDSLDLSGQLARYPGLHQEAVDTMELEAGVEVSFYSQTPHRQLKPGVGDSSYGLSQTPCRSLKSRVEVSCGSQTLCR